jgi:A/G-specific adenine glycosylase
MKPAARRAFQKQIFDYYKTAGRHQLPWRLTNTNDLFDPYKITVSELMLQQTQVSRVIPKYQEFLKAFPTVQALADAPLSEVLIHWSGLGYNRRAKFLWQTAQKVCDDFGGSFPRTKNELVQLPGIGANTAGAIMAYAFNEPVLFIETNIRTVFIHHFYADQIEVADSALVPLIEASLPRERPREWYWALMDYGSHLKQTVGNLSRASRSYTKQSAFQGSRRQIRGQVLRLLTSGAHPLQALQEAIGDERLKAVLTDLVNEDLIEHKGAIYQLRML